jgi:uncharacterized membrane protein
MASFCSSCGAQMADGATFCPACGKSSTQSTVGGAAVAPASAGAQASAGGLSDNVAGALAYLLIPAIVFLVVEPYNRNRFIRFHSFQSLILAIGNFVLQAVLWMIPIIGWLAGFLLSIAVLIAWVICLIKAFQGQMFKLPVIGDFAEKQANS